MFSHELYSCDLTRKADVIPKTPVKRETHIRDLKNKLKRVARYVSMFVPRMLSTFTLEGFDETWALCTSVGKCLLLVTMKRSLGAAPNKNIFLRTFFENHENVKPSAFLGIGFQKNATI